MIRYLDESFSCGHISAARSECVFHPSDILCSVIGSGAVKDLTMRWSERLAALIPHPHEIPPSTRSDALSRQPSLILFSLDASHLKRFLIIIAIGAVVGIALLVWRDVHNASSLDIRTEASRSEAVVYGAVQEDSGV